MPEPYTISGKIQLFLHHIYEYQKGVRNMVLCTVDTQEVHFALQRLQKLQIDYVTQDLQNHHINLFFGKKECLEVVRQIIHKPLNQLTPEEDFILGVMLGYDICEQCKRYCKRK